MSPSLLRFAPLLAASSYIVTFFFIFVLGFTLPHCHEDLSIAFISGLGREPGSYHVFVVGSFVTAICVIITAVLEMQWIANVSASSNVSVPVKNRIACCLLVFGGICWFFVAVSDHRDFYYASFKPHVIAANFFVFCTSFSYYINLRLFCVLVGKCPDHFKDTLQRSIRIKKRAFALLLAFQLLHEIPFFFLPGAFECNLSDAFDELTFDECLTCASSQSEDFCKAWRDPSDDAKTRLLHLGKCSGLYTFLMASQWPYLLVLGSCISTFHVDLEFPVSKQGLPASSAAWGTCRTVTSLDMG